MNNILILNPFGIGDVLFTMPLVANVRRAYPKARVVYVGNRRTEDMLRNNPRIDTVWSYERDEFVAEYKRNPPAFVRKWLSFAGDIKQGAFDVVFDFSLNATFGFVCLYAGIPRRIGYDYKGRGRFLTHRLPLAGFEGRHVADYYLELLQHAGVPVVDRRLEFDLTAQDEARARAWLADHGVPAGKRLVAVVPGGGASWGAHAGRKRWPAAKYAELVDKMIAHSPVAVILLGDSKEDELCRDIAKRCHHPLHSAVGRTTLVEMAALLKQCRLAVVNDGGPLHVAAAVGTRTVSIFGPVDPRVYGPYPPEGHTAVTLGLPCQPCYRNFRVAGCSHLNCLQHLSVDQVYQHVERSL